MQVLSHLGLPNSPAVAGQDEQMLEQGQRLPPKAGSEAEARRRGSVLAVGLSENCCSSQECYIVI